MFSFITRTWNPIAGGFVEEDEIFACPFRCTYCFTRDMINNRFPALKKKYTGPYRIHDPAMKIKFKPTDFVFVCDMCDIGAPGIPRTVIIDVFETIRFWEAKGTRFLLLTKNPQFYKDWKDYIPEHTVLGATIETGYDSAKRYSLAPLPHERLQAMNWCRENLPNRRFISVEPIMRFNYKFANNLIFLEPWAVAVGYDNYDNGLPEPSMEKTEWLIKCLEVGKIKVYRKNIREARQ